MDIKDFASEIYSSALNDAQKNSTNLMVELARKYLDIMCEYGEIASYEICSFQKRHAALTAYSYNEELESIDLFLFKKTASVIGKIEAECVYEKYASLSAFYREALREAPFFGASIDSEVQSAISLIKEVKGKVKRMRLYFLTNGIVESSSSLNFSEYLEKEELLVENMTWDIVRLNRVNSLNIGNDAIEIDFLLNFKKKIQCLRVEDENPKVDAYFAIMPGDVLAKVYNQYKQTLMENNVRLFLQKTNKVNRQMCKTIKERPGMFFSFNNGISATAKCVEFGSGGTKTAPFITKITDLQIVNGGQTTATIAAMQECDLSKVFVPMKISVIKDLEEYSGLVKDISTAANCQSAIKRSDFLSGDEILQKLESISRQVVEPHSNTKWYFERKRGQYKNDQANRIGYERTLFSESYPQSQIIDKSVVARFATLWDMRPYDACKSKEVVTINYFNSLKERNNVNIDAVYYQNIVSLHILTEEIKSYMKRNNYIYSYGAYANKVTNYLIASIKYLTEGNFDLNYIWVNQEIQEKFLFVVDPLMKLIIEHFDNGYNGKYRPNFDKDPNCWEELMVKLNSMPPLLKKQLVCLNGVGKIEDDESNISKVEVMEVNETEGEEEKQVDSLPDEREIIEQAFSIPASIWEAMAIWGEKTGNLTVSERLRASTYAYKRKSLERFKVSTLAQNALNLEEKARNLGFKWEEIDSCSSDME